MNSNTEPETTAMTITNAENTNASFSGSEGITLNTEIQRPAFLAPFENLRSDLSATSKDLYTRFLMEAEQAKQNNAACEVRVSSTFKYSIAKTHSNETDTMASITSVKDTIKFSDECNSSLQQIFMFYAQLQQVYTATFQESDLQNETMNLLELIIFCRDFRLIPKLLTQKDVKLLFSDLQREKTMVSLSAILASAFFCLPRHVYIHTSLHPLPLSLLSFLFAFIDLYEIYLTITPPPPQLLHPIPPSPYL